MVAYQYQPYPRMLYKGDLQRTVVDFREEVSAKMEGWKSSPDDSVGGPPQKVVLAVDVPDEPAVEVPPPNPPDALGSALEDAVITLAVEEPPVVLKRRPGRPRKEPF